MVQQEVTPQKDKQLTDLILKEIPIFTCAVVVFYILIYFFNYGYSDFFGYPKLFINVSVSSFFSPAFAIYSGVLFTLITFRFYSEAESIPYYAQVIWGGLVFIGLGFYIIRDFDSYFYNNMSIIFVLLALSFSIVSCFNITLAIANGNSYKNVQGAVYFSFAIFALPYFTGWVAAYTKDDAFMTNGMYLIAKYDSSYIFGKCKNQNSEFYILSPNMNNKFEAVSDQNNKQIKTCFRLAARTFGVSHR